MTICSFVCFLEGLHNSYWLKPNEKSQKMGLGPTLIPLREYSGSASG